MRSGDRGKAVAGTNLVPATQFANATAARLRGIAARREAPVAVSRVEYPDGGGEVSAVLARDPGEKRKQGTKGQGDRERSKTEAGRRAKSQVRRFARFYNLRFMVTLTFPGDGVHDYEKSYKVLSEFVHHHGWLLHQGAGFYLSVPELHPGGHGWHWHVLVSQRYSREALTRLRVGWTEFLISRGFERPIREDGSAGFVRVHVKPYQNAKQAAGYAAKYVGKTFEEGTVGFGRQRYLRSKGHTVKVKRWREWSLDRVLARVREEAPEAFVFDTRQTAQEGTEWTGPPMVYASW